MSATTHAGAVLVAEDDDGARALVVETLRRAGLEVTEAACGRSAVDAATRERPCLVVLDVALPVLSGYEVCRHLRELHGRDVPIIFLSGERIEPHDRVAGLLLGADDYMVKPFAADELVARVRNLLRRAQLPARGAPRLTKRESEVLARLAHGHSQAQIAAELVIAPKTVGTHIERILEKLEVHSRAEAVAVAYRDGLVSAPA